MIYSVLTRKQWIRETTLHQQVSLFDDVPRSLTRHLLGHLFGEMRLFTLHNWTI